METRTIAALTLVLFLASVLPIYSAKQVAATPASDLIGLWHFDEFENMVTFDSSGYGNDGTLVNMGPKSKVNGIFRHALEFDGVDDYVDIEDSSFNVHNFTIEAWVYPHRIDGNRWIWMKGIRGQLMLEAGYAFGIEDGNMSLYLRFGPAAKMSILAHKISAGSWQHCVVTIDSGKVRMYLNGKLPGTGLIVFSPPTINFTDLEPRIGANMNGTELFDGLIDEVRFWSRALSKDEVAASYGLGRHPYARIKEKDLNRDGYPDIIFNSAYTELADGEEITIYIVPIDPSITIDHIESEKPKPKKDGYITLGPHTNYNATFTVHKGLHKRSNTLHLRVYLTGGAFAGKHVDFKAKFAKS